jgi:hypothetical protein
MATKVASSSIEIDRVRLAAPFGLAGQSVGTPGRLTGLARLAIALEIFLSLGALFGGGQFILAPDGHLLGMTVKSLSATPFPSFLIPGILLFTFVGVGPLVAAALTIRRHALAPMAAVAVGLTLLGWVTVEMVMLAGFVSLLWAFYVALGTAIGALGIGWWRSELRTPLASAAW